MGRPAETTDNDIIQAGLELERRSNAGTVRPGQIRDFLGRGNTTRIARIWNAFLERRKLEEAEAKAAKAALPRAVRELLAEQKVILQARLEVVCANLYAAAERELLMQHSADRQALTEELEKVQQELGAAYAHNDAIFQTRVDAETAAAAAAEDRDEQRRRADQADSKAATLEAILGAEREALASIRAENALLIERAVRAEEAVVKFQRPRLVAGVGEANAAGQAD